MGHSNRLKPTLILNQSSHVNHIDSQPMLSLYYEIDVNHV